MAKSKYAIYEEKVLPDNILIKNLRKAAKIYEQYAGKKILIVYARGKRGPFYTYEFYAGEKNFQHLAGVKSPQGAVWFFRKCLDDKNIVKREDIVPKKDIKTTSAKIGVLPDAIDLKNVKAYKFGKKDLITFKAEFDVALGNPSNIMRLAKRDEPLPIPVTVMDRSIYEFCSQASPVFLIMTKDKKDDKYKNVFFERTKDILEKAEFNDEIWELIEHQKEETESDVKSIEMIEEVAATVEIIE